MCFDALGVTLPRGGEPAKPLAPKKLVTRAFTRAACNTRRTSMPSCAAMNFRRSPMAADCSGLNRNLAQRLASGSMMRLT